MNVNVFIASLISKKAYSSLTKLKVFNLNSICSLSTMNAYTAGKWWGNCVREHFVSSGFSSSRFIFFYQEAEISFHSQLTKTPSSSNETLKELNSRQKDRGCINASKETMGGNGIVFISQALVKLSSINVPESSQCKCVNVVLRVKLSAKALHVVFGVLL